MTTIVATVRGSMAEVAEADLERAFVAGMVVDCADGERRRSVDAALLRWLIVRRSADFDPHGIRLRHAMIAGTLDLAGVELPVPLRFDDCEFEAAPDLAGARLVDLALVDCVAVPGLLANGLTVQRDVDISGSVFTGAHRTTAGLSEPATIWLVESSIGGQVLCAGTAIKADRGRGLHADRMRVAGPVRLVQGFHASGEVRLAGAQLDGGLDLTGARIESSGPALDLSDAVVTAGVSVAMDTARRRPTISGRICLDNARIGGQVYLCDAVIDHGDTGPQASGQPRPASDQAVLSAARLVAGAGVAFAGATSVTGMVDLSASDLGAVVVGSHCRLTAPGRTALDLTNAQLRTSLDLSPGVRLRGTLRLVGARVSGNVNLGGVVLTEPEGKSLIKADGLTVDGDLDLSGLTATAGSLKLWRATIGGGIDATAAVLSNPDGCTLRLHQSTVGGSVRLVDDFTSHGCLLLNRSIIDGRLDCSGGSFSCDRPSQLNAGGHAVQAVSATVRGGMSLGWRAVSPSVDLTDAATTVLADDPRTWPARFVVAGFRYDRFDLPAGASDLDIWDWRGRTRWLRRQSLYDAGPYEQAARVFRQHGYTYGAEQMLIAQRTHARRATRRGSAPRRWLNAVYGWTVGYGFRPGRVLWLLVLLMALVTASLMVPAAQSTLRASDEGEVFSTTGPVPDEAGPAVRDAKEQPDGCANGRIRCFHPVLYAIDTVMPLVSLDQRSTWYPNPNQPWGWLMQWWLNLATVAGWLLSSIFLLSIARLARSI
ncbi:MAG TPA: hypothetical protein VF163_20030 [Micromonosporaceae bacterium]